MPAANAFVHSPYSWDGPTIVPFPIGVGIAIDSGGGWSEGSPPTLPPSPPALCSSSVPPPPAHVLSGQPHHGPDAPWACRPLSSLAHHPGRPSVLPLPPPAPPPEVRAPVPPPGTRAPASSLKPTPTTTNVEPAGPIHLHVRHATPPPPPSRGSYLLGGRSDHSTSSTSFSFSSSDGLLGCRSPHGVAGNGPSDCDRVDDCIHPKPWKRLRAKRGFTFFACQRCGEKWRLQTSAHPPMGP